MIARLRIAVLVCMVQFALVPASKATEVRDLADLAFRGSTQARVVAYDHYSSFVRVGMHETSGWTCAVLDDAPGMGGRASDKVIGGDGLSILEVMGTPYIAFTAKKFLPTDPVSCGGESGRVRRQLWLQIGTTVSLANQVCIDSAGVNYGCINVSDLGYHVSIARGGDGKIHAAYRTGSGALRYAVSNTAVTSFSAESVGVAATSGAGGDIAIAVDGSGAPHIAFIRGGLYRYAVKSGATWAETTLAVPAYSAGYAGRALTSVSLKLDGSGLASIAFSVGDSLWFAQESASMQFGTAELIDGGSGFEGYPSLVRASNGNIHVSYCRGASGLDLVYYALRSSGTWGSPVLAASEASPLGSFTNKRQTIGLTNGSPQLPRIAYPAANPAGGSAIWLAESDGSSWSTNVVLPCDEGGGGGGGGGGGDHDPYYDGMSARAPIAEAGALLPRLQLVQAARGQIQALISDLRAGTGYRVDLLDVTGRRLESLRGVSGGPSNVHTFRRLQNPGLYLVRLRTEDGGVLTAKAAVVR